MLNKHEFFDLINAANVSSRLLDGHLVKSIAEFEEYSALYSGIPILIPANQRVFEFSRSDVFELSQSCILNVIYGINDNKYIGFKHAFPSTSFLSNFEVKKDFKVLFEKIITQNKSAVEQVAKFKKSFSTVGAFQTRNIPHFGHEEIIKLMLDRCDHLVINPVIGPKKSGDISLTCLEEIYNNFMKRKYNGRISFLPIFANMFYAGPREAFHHAIIRQNLGFDLFSVGRDHAGADNFFNVNDAPNLVKKYQSFIKMKVLSHLGAVFCLKCEAAVLRGECKHNANNFLDISGSSFRNCLKNKKIFEFADFEMQEYLFSRNLEIFEK